MRGRVHEREYVAPGDVSSPRKHWKLLSVLDAGARSTGSIALGRWDDKPVLAMRWNGDTTNPLGNPQSRGLATWFIVPDQYRDPILASLSPASQTLANAFFGLR